MLSQFCVFEKLFEIAAEKRTANRFSDMSLSCHRLVTISVLCLDLATDKQYPHDRATDSFPQRGVFAASMIVTRWI